DRVGLELDPHARIVAIHRLDQADRAVADDVLRAEHARHADRHPPDDVLHQRRVLHDHLLAQRRVARGAQAGPESVQLSGLRHHLLLSASARRPGGRVWLLGAVQVMLAFDAYKMVTHRPGPGHRHDLVVAENEMLVVAEDAYCHPSQHGQYHADATG